VMEEHSDRFDPAGLFAQSDCSYVDDCILAIVPARREGSVVISCRVRGVLGGRVVGLPTVSTFTVIGYHSIVARVSFSLNIELSPCCGIQNCCYLNKGCCCKSNTLWIKLLAVEFWHKLHLAAILLLSSAKL